MSHKSFSNTSCAFFPCHRVEDNTGFNCMFCYCPLYAMGTACGGKFAILPGGVKDCSPCDLPHRGEQGWEYVVKRLGRGK